MGVRIELKLIPNSKTSALMTMDYLLRISFSNYSPNQMGNAIVDGKELCINQENIKSTK